MRVRLSLLLCALLILALSCGSTTKQPGDQLEEMWVGYEPSEVSLEGRLVVENKFGPPNWGENPDTDMKLHVPMLILSRPLNVRRDPNSDVNDETFTGVQKVQLQIRSDYQKLVGKEVVATGSLYAGQTGWHFTDVLMSVKSIRST